MVLTYSMPGTFIIIVELSWELLRTHFTRLSSVRCAGEVPHRVNSTLWNNSSSYGMKLFFAVPRDRNPATQVMSATLNLFLKPGAGQCRLHVHPCRNKGAVGHNRSCNSCSVRPRHNRRHNSGCATSCSVRPRYQAP
jgi:hypothetical protein